MFTGTVKVKLCEATDLRPTAFQERLGVFGSTEQSIDPYVSIDMDEVVFHRYENFKTLIHTTREYLQSHAFLFISSGLPPKRRLSSPYGMRFSNPK